MVCSDKRKYRATYEATSENPDQNQDAVSGLLVICWLKCFSLRYTAIINNLLAHAMPHMSTSIIVWYAVAKGETEQRMKQQVKTRIRTRTQLDTCPLLDIKWFFS